jgi:hypothetical protein
MMQAHHTVQTIKPHKPLTLAALTDLQKQQYIEPSRSTTHRASRQIHLPAHLMTFLDRLDEDRFVTAPWHRLAHWTDLSLLCGLDRTPLGHSLLPCIGQPAGAALLDRLQTIFAKSCCHSHVFVVTSLLEHPLLLTTRAKPQAVLLLMFNETEAVHTTLVLNLLAHGSHQGSHSEEALRRCTALLTACPDVKVGPLLHLASPIRMMHRAQIIGFEALQITSALQIHQQADGGDFAVSFALPPYTAELPACEQAILQALKTESWPTDMEVAPHALPSLVVSSPTDMQPCTILLQELSYTKAPGDVAVLRYLPCDHDIHAAPHTQEQLCEFILHAPAVLFNPPGLAPVRPFSLGIPAWIYTVFAINQTLYVHRHTLSSHTHRAEANPNVFGTMLINKWKALAGFAGQGDDPT